MRFSTSFSKSQIELLVGFSDRFQLLARAQLTADIPSEFGMFVYRLVTSRVHRMLSLGNFSLPSNHNKWPLSLTYKFNFGTSGWIKRSTN